MSAAIHNGAFMSIFVLLVLAGAFAAILFATLRGSRGVAPHAVWRPWAALGVFALAGMVGFVLLVFVARTTRVVRAPAPVVQAHVESYNGSSAHTSDASRAVEPTGVAADTGRPGPTLPVRIGANGKPVVEMQIPVPHVEGPDEGSGVGAVRVESFPPFQFPNAVQFPTVTIDGEPVPVAAPTETSQLPAPEAAANQVPDIELPDGHEPVAVPNPDLMQSTAYGAAVDEYNAAGGAAAGESAAPDAWARLLAAGSRKGEALELDPHPSLDTLQTYVIERVGAEVEKLGGPAHDRPVRINADQTVSLDFVNRLSTTLGAAMIGQLPQPGSKVETRPTGDTWVDVRWENHNLRTPAWSSRPVLKGKLVARISGPRGSSVVSANLDEKPWLYEGVEPSGKFRPIVAMSGGPEISESLALQAVWRDAEAKIYPMVVAAFQQMSPGSSVINHDAALRHALRVSLNTNARLLDQAFVRVRRNYGDVWYAAQLRDVSDHMLRPVAAQAIQADHHRKQTFAQMVAGLVGMTVVLGVLYVLLNWFTRGYFRGRIGAAVVVTGVIAGAVLLLLKS